MKWVIVSCNYGRLGNRLHTHANILAWCISNEYNLSNLSFKSYSELFQKQRHHSSDSYFKTKNIVWYMMKINFICNFIERLILSKKWMRRLSFFLYYIEKDNFSTLEEEELNLIKKNKIIVINAWDIRCPKSIKLVGHKVKRFLQPTAYYLDKAKRYVTTLKKSYHCIVGVHARRGDYKTYLGGKHFHSWESYQKWIMELRSVLEKQGHKKIGFILCSDDNPSKWIFNDAFIHFTDLNDFMTDLHILTLCDLNIGPPSSFGTWISWYGQVPRMEIYKDSRISNLDEFKISSSC